MEDIMRKSLTILLAAAVLAAPFAASADDWHGNRGNHNGWGHEREWHHHRPICNERAYYAPRVVYYNPAPVVVYPRPVYYAPPAQPFVQFSYWGF